MWTYAKRGWSIAWRSWFPLLILFLYQYAWGFALFNFVKSIVVPLLHRYPGASVSEGASRLFWIEAQFQLTKTDAAAPYLWTLAAIVAARMLLTPLINGGIYNVLHHRGQSQRKMFFAGARTYAKPLTLLYLLQTALAVAPLFWLLPRGIDLVLNATGGLELAAKGLPWAAGWLIYQGILELVCLYVGFGIVAGRSVRSSLGAFFRSVVPASGVALLVFAVAGAVGLAVASASLYWAGFIAVVIHQAYPVVRVLLRLWGIGSQYELWSSRQRTA